MSLKSKEPMWNESTLSYTDSAEVSSWDVNPRKLFDITAVIGSVYDDPNGQFSPRQAAFIHIANYTEALSDRTTFQFPNEDGSINHIIVEREPTKTK